MHVLIIGDPVDGFRLVGPFLDPDEASHSAEHFYRDQTWWSADMEDPYVFQRREVLGSEIQPGDVLQGDSGGYSRVNGNVSPSSAMPGLIAVETEHGTLYADPDTEYTVLRDDVKHVNVYRIERYYGGPEEGGWWFDTGTVEMTWPCTTQSEVDAAIAELTKKYPRTGNRGKVHGGADFDIRVEGHTGKSFPTETPHYS